MTPGQRRTVFAAALVLAIGDEEVSWSADGLAKKEIRIEKEGKASGTVTSAGVAADLGVPVAQVVKAMIVQCRLPCRRG